MESPEAYQPYLDRVVRAYAGEAFRDELLRAKGEYFRDTGEVHEDDSFFELRMASFFDWYLFDRAISGDTRSPVQRYFLDQRASMAHEERQVFQGFVENVHSLFELKRRRLGLVVLHDWLAGEKRVVVERRERSGLDRGDLFEARLIPFEGELYFTRGFCFFPRQARRYIVRQAKRARKDGGDSPRELIRRLAYLRYLQERFRHVDVGRIYSDEGLSLVTRRAGLSPE
jgi:hypothetical protein